MQTVNKIENLEVAGSAVARRYLVSSKIETTLVPSITDRNVFETLTSFEKGLDISTCLSSFCCLTVLLNTVKLNV